MKGAKLACEEFCRKSRFACISWWKIIPQSNIHQSVWAYNVNRNGPAILYHCQVIPAQRKGDADRWYVMQVLDSGQGSESVYPSNAIKPKVKTLGKENADKVSVSTVTDGKSVKIA